MKWNKPVLQSILSEVDMEHMELLGDWSWSGQGPIPWSGQMNHWCGQWAGQKT